jgi:hypothetical protein
LAPGLPLCVASDVVVLAKRLHRGVVERLEVRSGARRLALRADSPCRRGHSQVSNAGHPSENLAGG